MNTKQAVEIKRRETDRFFPAAIRILAALIFGLFSVHPAFAGDGDLDLTFGNGGKVNTDFAHNSDSAFGLAIQSDGKIVAVGQAIFAERATFGVARYNSDGSSDPTFGGGKVSTSFGNSFGDSGANAVAIQSDGKIVVAGSTGGGSSTDFALARYNPDGTLDPSFGSGGTVTTDFAGGDDYAHAVAIRSDGRIIVAGYATNGSTGVDFALARYLPNGSLDPSFGSGGKVTTDFAGGDDYGVAMALQDDGKIVEAGSAKLSAFVISFAVARYNPNGSLDSTFGNGGRATTTFSSSDDAQAQAVAIQSDGKIVLAGAAFNPSTFNDFALARFNPDGTLDSSFGTGGKTTTAISSADDFARGVVIQPNGKIVVAGSTLRSATSVDFSLERYTPDGFVDNSFGSFGQVATDFAGGDDGAYGIALQSDGKIVVAGSVSESPNGTDFGLARYFGQPVSADLSITKTAQPDVLSAGDTLTYSLIISNAGPDRAPNVVVTDAVPDELHIVSTTVSGIGGSSGRIGNTITDGFLFIEPGQIATITVVTTVDSNAPNGLTLANTATVSADTSDPNPGNNSSSVTTLVLNPHPLTFYLHGNDISGTAGGFTMNQTPAPSQTLSLNLLGAPSWFSEPALNGTFLPGATFTFVMPRTVGLNVNVTYRLSATNPDGSGGQLLGQVTRSLGLGFGGQTIAIPVATPVTLNNQRLKLTLSATVGLNLNLQMGGNTFLEATDFLGIP